MLARRRAERLRILRTSEERARVIAIVANLISDADCPHPVRVAVDGPDAAGKTVLAGELAAALEERGRYAIRTSIDGFHRPRKDRYRRGTDSPVGYFRDSFDYALLREAPLAPRGADGTRRFRRHVFDYRSDAPLDEPTETTPDDAVLLFDGIFLLRQELSNEWDVRIFVDASFDETLRRAVVS